MLVFSLNFEAAKVGKEEIILFLFYIILKNSE